MLMALLPIFGPEYQVSHMFIDEPELRKRRLGIKRA
jgi:hypothetical protein